MSYYMAAYVVFWAALFGYLLLLVRRQSRLVARSAQLVDRLAARSEEGSET
jgi:CcmD family protein